MKRIVEPEWLDELPANDPAAIGSRRDLTKLNRLMGHLETMRELLEAATRPARIVELGAGDGLFMLRLARHFSSMWPGVEVVLVDAKNAVSRETRDEFAALGWKVAIAEADVFDWLAGPALPSDLMIANLFLHQFADAPLARMLELSAGKTNMFAACEPHRAAIPLAFSRMVGFIGCNAVTRHDAPVSVRAGFFGNELSALWPWSDGGRWQFKEGKAHLFTHTFVAQRILAK